MGGAWALKRIDPSFHYGLAGENCSGIFPARLMEVFMLAKHLLPKRNLKTEKPSHECGVHQPEGQKW
jgi:hypothetical protein